MEGSPPSDEKKKDRRARGPKYDYDFEESEWERDTSSESSQSEDRGFVVDQELDDSDAEQYSSQRSKDVYDCFLYDFCEFPANEYDKDDAAIKEDGVSDNERGLDRDTDDESCERGTQFGTHDPTAAWNKMKPHLGERFANQEQLRNCLVNYAVANGYPIRIVKSSTTRLQAKCGTDKRGKECPFKMWASWMNNERSFQINGIDEKHTCVRDFRRSTLVNPEWIAKHFVKQLCKMPRMKAREIKEAVKQKFLCDVSKGQCYRAKHKALEIINGKLTDHYGRIWDYAAEILRSNPGSTAKVGVNVNPDGRTYFHRFYVCFKAIREWWSRDCRRVVGLDGCFLKGQCKGELLTGIGRDVNNHAYPIAWAVVDVENKSNWLWFLELLRYDIQVGDGGGLTIISDQHKGLMEAAKDVLPRVEHRQCARHVFANFKKSYNGYDYKRLFWEASFSTTEAGFARAMEELKSINKNAYEYLVQRDPNTWSRAFFAEGKACAAVENGISESFNFVILEARSKPILTMLEEIRIYVMETFFIMSTKHSRWTQDICPSILRRFKEDCADMRLWVVIASQAQLFEVKLGFESFQVDLEQGLCTCRLWEIFGIPCIHACAAMNYTHQHPEEFISSWFSKEKFVTTYKGNIRPMNGSSMWPKTTYTKPLPPIPRRMPGRPKTKRRRHVTEDDGGYKRLRATGGSKICTKCWEQGHNKRTCKKKPKPQPEKIKKKMGRPLKSSQNETVKKASQRPKTGTSSQRPRTGSSSQVKEKMAEGVAGVHQTADAVTQTNVDKMARPKTGSSSQVKEKMAEGVAGVHQTAGAVTQTNMEKMAVDKMSHRKGKENMVEGTAEVDKGLQDVEVVLTTKGHRYGDDLLQSKYTMEEVLECFKAVPLEVEQLTPEDEEQGGIEETQPDLDVDVDVVPETQPAVQQVRKVRKKSERIMKKKISKKFDGPGESIVDPLTLE